MSYPGATAGGKISTGNSSSTLLTAGSTFTGAWEDVSSYPDVIVALTTDQNSTITVEFSPDGVNVDSSLTRYYWTGRISAPHRFTVGRAYARIKVTNTSASDQTYLRLQTMYGAKTVLNAPLDSTLAQDFDATPTRPSSYHDEIALGQRQGVMAWNKWGYNLDVDIAAPEVIASWGGTFTPMETARTLSVVSTSANDTTAGSGAESIIIYGLDENRETQTVVVTMNGLTPVVTSELWLGINRMSVYASGSSKANEGEITATATTDLTTQGQMPAGQGTTQQAIFFTQAGHTALFKWLVFDGIRFGSGTEPVITLKAWVWSAVSGSKYEVGRFSLDLGSGDTDRELTPAIPFAVGEQSCFWLEAETTRDNTQLKARFSLTEHRLVGS